MSERATLIVSNLYQIPPNARNVTVDKYDEITGELATIAIVITAMGLRKPQPDERLMFGKTPGPTNHQPRATCSRTPAFKQSWPAV